MKVLVVTSMYPTAVRPHSGPWIKAQVDSLTRVGVESTLLVLQGKGLSKYVRGAGQLFRFARPADYDLVHAHYGYCGILARMQWRVPVVVTFHGDDLLGTPGTNGQTTALSGGTVLASQVLAHTVDGVIVQSKRMLERLRPRPRVPTEVIPMGIDLSVFCPAPRTLARRRLGLDPDLNHRFVLFVADPAIPRKAFPIAQAAVECLQQEGIPVELLVVFDKPQLDVVDFYNASDVLVLPSFIEGSPNAVKEALACDLPVVAADAGDVREMLEGMDGSAMVERTPQAFARAIRSALDIQGGRTNSRERMAHLSVEATAERVRALYEAAASYARRRGARSS